MHEIRHVDEVLKLLSVMTGDDRYMVISVEEEGKVKNMCEVAQRLINSGVKQGIDQGRAEGENRLARLINELIADGRQEDVVKVTTDEKVRREMYKEYGITD